MKFLAVYLLFINVVAFVVCVADKIKSKLDDWRVPEKTLFIISAIGGSVGMYLDEDAHTSQNQAQTFYGRTAYYHCFTKHITGLDFVPNGLTKHIL